MSIRIYNFWQMNDLGTYALQICTSKIQEERRHPNHVHGYKYVF